MPKLRYTLAALAALGLAGWGGLRLAGERTGDAKAAAPSMMMMAMPVPIAPVIKKNLPIYLSYPGRIEAIRGISLQARVPGYIEAQLATDGGDVKAGDLLYKIDPRDLQAALDQARAQADRDAASLEYARSNFSRGRELLKSGYVAKDAYDQRSSTMRAAEAGLAADQAAVATAKLNLSYCEIRAPFSGRLGKNLAAKGALVGPATGPLNTLVQLDPLYVTFNLSETELADISQARARGKVEAEISTPDEPKLTVKGELSFLDNGVDRSTGTLVARVTIPNHDFALLPGQYVRVKLLVRDQPDALMAPVAALGANQMGNYVYLVGQGDKAELRPVQVGVTDGALVNIVKGVSEGEQVIVGNLQKIGPGSPVQALPPKPAAP